MEFQKVQNIISDMHDRRIINTTIQAIFDRYNGQINTCNNRAYLYINWAQLNGSNIGGCTRLPDIVEIYPVQILIEANDFQHFLTIVLHTVIHELFHIDQILNFDRMQVNLLYNTVIEAANDTQTILYISSNLNNISNFIGFDVHKYYTKEYTDQIYSYDKTLCTYRRRTFYDHILMCMTRLFPEENYKIISDYILNKKDNGLHLVMSIDRSEFTIVWESSGYMCRIEDFNNFIRHMYETTFLGIDFEYWTYEVEGNEVLVLDFVNPILKNEMCVSKNKIKWR